MNGCLHATGLKALDAKDLLEEHELPSNQSGVENALKDEDGA